MLRRISAPPERYPLLLVPYLSEERLAELEAAGVSGVDLCGNGVVVVPGELLVLRSGAPNRFRWEGTIKNVYRKESSLAARIFLLVREFGSVGAVLEEIQRRGGELTLSTVSKVCKALEADLIIRRELRPPRVKRSPILPWGGQVPLAQPLRLLQPEKLLDLLAANYTPPQISGRYTGKCEFAPMVLREQLAGWAEGSGVRIALTGASSVEAYAVMAREPVQAFYCSDVEEVLRSLGDNVRETDRFANVAFLETSDGLAYFDRRPGLVASPVQTYLELVSGDKRERETAEQVRRVILEALARDAGKE
ncbi:MAG TPA: hypothetical protein VEL76_31740 [Gemmataceae bacterium]|nr:hypothetical protein [Gemmataceae bacterium]